MVVAMVSDPVIYAKVLGELLHSGFEMVVHTCNDQDDSFGVKIGGTQAYPCFAVSGFDKLCENIIVHGSVILACVQPPFRLPFGHVFEMASAIRQSAKEDAVNPQRENSRHVPGLAKFGQ